MAASKADNWSSEAYQTSASFVPKLTTKILSWLDVQPDDRILDLGCGDGILNIEIAQKLVKGSGTIHGIDSSPSMISSAIARASSHPACTFEVLDAKDIGTSETLKKGHFNKVFSNAALHWILRPEGVREGLFEALRGVLEPGGRMVFEMGGAGNVGEMRTALLSATARRIGIERAREVDPWFFPDETWVKRMLEGKGWVVEKVEREWRPTAVDEGGIEGWVRLMGKVFFDAVGEKERESCVREVCEVLESVCAAPDGGMWIGYVRLRVCARFRDGSWTYVEVSST